MPRWLMVFLALVALAVGGVLILFVTAKAAGYPTLGAMLNHIVGELGFIWGERITA